MKKKVLSILLSLLMILLLVPGLNAQLPNIDYSPAVNISGSQVTISGAATIEGSPAVNRDITLRIVDSQNRNILADQVTPKDNGSYSFGPYRLADGSYTAYVGGLGTVQSKTFTVNAASTPGNGESNQYYAVNIATVVGGTATVKADKTEAAEGQTVTVTISNIESGKKFKSITVKGADGSAVATTAVSVGASYTFTMPAKAVTVTVELENVSTGGGGGGGVVVSTQAVTSTNGSAKVPPAAGGSISLGDNVTIEIPANALQGTSSVEVKIAKIDIAPALPEGFALASPVFEFTVDGKGSYSFSKKVKIKIKLDNSMPGINPAIYYYDETANAWRKLGGSISGDYITVEVDHFTRMAVLAEKQQVASQPSSTTPRFTDMEKHWASSTVMTLVNKGVISGYPDGTFKPERTMTRTEFAVLVVKSMGLQPVSAKAVKFKDKNAIPAWAQGYVAAAVKAGILPQVWGTSFKPKANITRADMAYMIGKALKAKVSKKPQLKFKDKIPSWAAGYVAYCQEKHIISGYPDRTFKPSRSATRAEACTIIVNALQVSAK